MYGKALLFGERVEQIRIGTCFIPTSIHVTCTGIMVESPFYFEVFDLFSLFHVNFEVRKYLPVTYIQLDIRYEPPKTENLILDVSTQE